MNQRARELMRLADSMNHTEIDDEITKLNSDWNTRLNEVESRIETSTALCTHWEDFEKRIEVFENQLHILRERISNTDFVVKSKQHLFDTKHIYQVCLFWLKTFF